MFEDAYQNFQIFGGPGKLCEVGVVSHFFAIVLKSLILVFLLFQEFISYLEN